MNKDRITLLKLAAAVVLTSLFLTAQTADATGLVTHVPMNEGSGQTAADGPGSNDLQLGSSSGPNISDPTWLSAANSKLGNSALLFEGGDWLVRGSSSVPTGTSSRTMTYWAYINTMVNSYFGGYGTLQADRLCSLGVTNAVGWKLTFHAGSYDFNTSIACPATDEWHHYAVRYDGSTVYVTLDGITTDSTAKALNTGNSGINLGRRYDNVLRYWGRLDDFAIWDQFLTDAEVRALTEVGNNTGLNYDASDADQLFTLWETQTDYAIVDGRKWFYVSEGLGGTPGALQINDTNFTIRLGTGADTSGITTLPEPSSAALTALGALVLGSSGLRRWRSRKSSRVTP